jgi:hypothetical protein
MIDIRLRPSRRAGFLALALVVAGAGAAAIGLGGAPARTWVHLLVDAFYLVSLGVSAAFFAATQRLSGARWSAGLRRIPEAFMLTLPAGAVLLAVVSLAGRAIYPWTHPGAFAHESGIAGRVAYLQPGFVHARMAIVLLVWIGFALLFRRTSLAQDRDPARSMFLHGRLNLRRRGLAGGRSGDNQLGDLGKLLFAFATFWAYVWVCQYLLIWYGNIPEEATYYAARTGPGWLPLFAANFVVNWVVPFLVLLPARAKRSPRVLAGTSVLLLAGHWLDVYLLVAPSKWAAPRFGPGEAIAAAGCFALVYLIVARSISRAPLVPLHDPVLWADREGGSS